MIKKYNKVNIMKKFPIIIAAFCITFSYAQKVSDYKYIALAEKFTGFKNDIYGLDTALSKALKAKQYVVVTGNKNNWPSEVNSNPCSVLNADVINDSGFLKNKIILEFKDCNNKVIESHKASTSIKEFEAGYQDALRQALVKIPVSNPVNMIQQTQSAAVEATVVASVANENSSVSESKAEKFSNGKVNLQKIQIDNSQFILVEGNSSVPFATFKTTTKRDVFRVKLNSGNSTIGYYENGNIVIEIPMSNGEYSKEIFTSK